MASRGSELFPSRPAWRWPPPGWSSELRSFRRAPSWSFRLPGPFVREVRATPDRAAEGAGCPPSGTKFSPSCGLQLHRRWPCHCQNNPRWPMASAASALASGVQPAWPSFLAKSWGSRGSHAPGGCPSVFSCIGAGPRLPICHRSSAASALGRDGRQAGRASAASALARGLSAGVGKVDQKVVPSDFSSGWSPALVASWASAALALAQVLNQIQIWKRGRPQTSVAPSPVCSLPGKPGLQLHSRWPVAYRPSPGRTPR